MFDIVCTFTGISNNNDLKLMLILGLIRNIVIVVFVYLLETIGQQSVQS